MSPLTVRRFRAERLLQGEFEALRGRVLAAVRARLRGSGVTLDQSDLEACYATAWQGLYAAVLDGEEIDNPAGWLVLVTFRRAIEEHRARRRVHRGGDIQSTHAADSSTGADLELEGAHEPDLAAELDDRARLRHLFEGLRGRLSAREREAAVLCYLQGLSRAQAAERMGVSEARMRKLMEGAGVGRPGVAGKVGALVETIRDGGWCEEQGSLMRALAYGILDPEGERYQLALLHRSECPSCRVYVTSLRGLAATLPPVFLPHGLGAAALARVGGAHAGGVAGAAGGGAGGGALSASSAAGAGAGASGMAGGGWLFAGAGKLAAGCVLALSVGAGCVVLDVGGHSHTQTHRHRQAVQADTNEALGSKVVYDLAAAPPGSPAAGASPSPLTPSRRATREFGPEQALAAAGTQRSTAVEGSSTAVARAASAGSATRGATSGSSSAGGSRPSGSSAASAGGEAAAEREFSPG